jgi:hypothetical protein
VPDKLNHEGDFGREQLNCSVDFGGIVVHVLEEIANRIPGTCMFTLLSTVTRVKI